MKNFILYLFIGSVVFINCRQAPKTSEEESVQEEIDQSINDAQVAVQEFGQENEADTLLKPKDDTYPSFLATEMWEFTKGIVSGGNAKDHVTGRWIRFEEDKSFNTGVWENIITSGEWAVDTSGLLHLRPTDGTDRESEWRIRRKLNSMVWSGTPKFGNNTTQYFLVRSKSTPQQIF